MNRKLFAAALGQGVETAAQMQLADAKKMCMNNDAIVGDLFYEDGQILPSPSRRGVPFVRWRVEAIQELSGDEKGPSVELYVHASDGEYEIGLYFYVREFPEED